MNSWIIRNLGKAGSLLAFMLTLALIEGQAAGQNRELKLLPSDGAELDVFGSSISISGPPGNEIAIVGATGNDDNGSSCGSVYIFRKSGESWVQEAKLLASDGAADDFFGVSVSISGSLGNEIAIVGANGNDDNGPDSGSAYIFRKSGENWVQEAKLLASDGVEGDRFGSSVSISGDSGNGVAIVGAGGDDDRGTSSGSAYIFRFNPDTSGWGQEAKFLPSTNAAGDLFGTSVAISSASGIDVVIIGAKFDDDIGASSGSAYIHHFNPETSAWISGPKLHASDGGMGDLFGTSVAISSTPGNEVAIVGADRDIGSGSAYIYRFNPSLSEWTEEAKLLASDRSSFDQFGISVAISGDAAIVGAWGHDDNGPGSGSAYIYRFNPDTSEWLEELKLLPSDGAEADFFGVSVSINRTPGNEIAIVGADWNDDNGEKSGSVYIFRDFFYISRLFGDCNSNGINDLHDLFLNLTSSDCNDNGIPDECDIVSGLSLDADMNSIPDDCQASFPPDTNGDGAVNVTDLLALFAAWGPCP